MTADDVFARHGMAIFVAALEHHGAMSVAEARDALAAGDVALAGRLGQRLIDLFGDGREGWFKYEISEIGYNFDVTAYGYGDATRAREWEVLNEEDNNAVYVTRLGTMDALAAGLLQQDGPRFADLIARLHAHRRHDAQFAERDEAYRAAFRARRDARQSP